MARDELLDRAQHADLLRFATAGSVDDGKSTLIGRMLHDAQGIYDDQLAALTQSARRRGRSDLDLAHLTDGLKAEREQGITIDVAYRHFATPRRRFIIADVPGHEQYTRNMVTGASTADLAVILVDACQGVLTQSKRHAFIAALLGIPHLVVAVNKMDRAGYSRTAFEQIRDEYTSYCAKLRLRDLTFIPVSALCGDNVVQRSEAMPWYEGATLLSHLETVHISSDLNHIDFRFPVQYVNRPDAGFRGYCGTVASGLVRVGEEVVALPSGKVSRVSRLLQNAQEAPYAFAPQAVTICLEDDLDLSRGDMLAHPANLPWAAQALEAMLVWMDAEPLEPDLPYLVKHTTSLVRGRFTELQYRIDPDTLHRRPAERLGLNEIGRVAMHVYRPLFCDEYERNRQTGSFIVIDPRSNFTVAAGMIIDRAHRYETIHPSGRAAARRPAGPVERARLLGAKACTLWLTGLSGAGKTTLGQALEKRLLEEGQACCLLDGDAVRQGLNHDLGFSPEDRKENIRRSAEVARLFNEAGVIALTAFISPYRQDREAAREIIGESRFLEVHLDASLEECERRDPKGLYRKARAGELPDFTGISAPYEPPETPWLRLDTAQRSLEESVEQVLHLLRQAGVID